ncbi:hypothetical protein [Kytococcus sedentarius]|uniref:hypothetical protein n=1 Tax=Kytococcus sedentarius TaxID=1276 RepID=UPI0035BC7046
MRMHRGSSARVALVGSALLASAAVAGCSQEVPLHATVYAEGPVRGQTPQDDSPLTVTDPATLDALKECAQAPRDARTFDVPEWDGPWIALHGPGLAEVVGDPGTKDHLAVVDGEVWAIQPQDNQEAADPQQGVPLDCPAVAEALLAQSGQ